MTLYHLHGDLTRQTVNLVSRHGVIDVDMQRTNLYVWAIVMQYQVEHAMNALKGGNFFDNLFREFCRNTRTQQFVDRRSKHLDTSLDDHNGNQCAQDAIERHAPQQHHTSRDKCCQRDDGIKQRIRARGNQCVALQLLALALHVLTEDEFHHDGHHDNHQCGGRV